MTEETPSSTRTDRPTLGDVSHTNPHTGESFGATQVYDRGTTVAADGGADAGAGEGADASADEGGDASFDAERDPSTDGGQRHTADVDDVSDAAGATPERTTLKDVDHTPPGDTDGAHRTYERGREGRDEVR